MWTPAQEREIAIARNSAPSRSIDDFRALSAALSDVYRVGMHERSSFELLDPDTRALLGL
jgi:hypothetical protein